MAGETVKVIGAGGKARKTSKRKRKVSTKKRTTATKRKTQRRTKSGRFAKR